MRSIRYNITKEEAGLTIRQFLKSKGVSSRVITALKKPENGILLEGVHARTIDLLSEGEVLELNLPDSPRRLPLSDIRVPVAYEDEDVLVYNKPADMPCHQSGGHIYNTLASVWAADCRRRGVEASFRAINRLDKDTTGAVVVAKNQLAAGKLWKAVSKVYLAVVAGTLPKGHDIIDLPIDRVAPYEMEREVTPEGQQAVTEYRVLARGANSDASLVAFRLHTGRTHQIRVHMAHLGHPVLGDTLYGGPQELVQRQVLHCGQVSFPHVLTGEMVTVTAPLGEEFRRVMAACGLEADISRLADIFEA